jgi:hypothetical protein
MTLAATDALLTIYFQIKLHATDLPQQRHGCNEGSDGCLSQAP